MPVRIIVGLLLITGIVSCKGQNTSNPGNVTLHNACSTDPAIKYTLYTPSGYRAAELLPVFIAFDPAAKGDLPVRRYHQIAEKRRFIIMGSENSRNGQEANDLHRIASALLNEASEKYHADSSRIFLMGFSGGARSACAIGLYLTQVRGIIGVGAGFPGMNAIPNYSFDYFGIAGDHDFNLSELIDLDNELGKTGWQHELAIFPGGHNWPDSNVMDQAVKWILGERTKGSNTSYGEIYAIEKEKKYRQEIMNNFFTPDTIWWKNRIRRLKEDISNSRNKQDTLMDRRLLGFIGMMAWTKSTAAIHGNDNEQTLRMLTVYRYAEPDNPAVDSLFRMYYDKAGVGHGK